MAPSSGSPGKDAGQSPLRPRRRRPWMWWGAVLAVVLAVGTGAVFGARLDQDPALVTTPLIGEPVTDRPLPYLEQEGEISLQDLRGEIVVVNFWASWCVACREEHPALTAAASAYQDAGVKFVGIVFQDRESTATAFLDKMGRGENYLYFTDPGSRVAIDFGVFGVPETFFIDRQGRIAAKITGASTLPLVTRVLDEMLAGKRPDPTTKTGPVQDAPAE